MSGNSDLIANAALRIYQATTVSRSARLTARMLLDIADEFGHIRIEYAAALQATDIAETNTLRGHLVRLKDAGILDNYHLNGAVDVVFAGFPSRAISAQMITGRAQMITGGSNENDLLIISSPENRTFDQPRAAGDHEVPFFDQPRAAGDQRKEDRKSNLYISHARTPALVGWLVDTTPSTPGLLFEPTNQPNPDEASQAASLDAPGTETLPPPPPASTATSQLDPVEQAMSYSLLLAVRMIPANAKRLSRSFRFETIREAVAWWEMNRQSQGGRFEETPGIVVRWLDTPDKFAVPRLDPAWLQSEFGRRWRTKAEIEAERLDQEQKEAEQRQLLAEIEEEERQREEERQQAAALPADASLQDLWQHALTQLATSVPASTFNTWVKDTHVEGWEEETLLIAASNQYACDWLQNRLRPMVKRLLTNISGQAIDIRFVVSSAPIVRPAG